MKNKGYLAGIIALAAAMVALIPVAVALTGGRDINDFLPRDHRLFIGFLLLEIVIIIAMFILANRLGKLNRSAQPFQPRTLSSQEKALSRRGLALLFSSLAVAFLLSLAGITIGKRFMLRNMSVLYGILACSCFTPPILLVLSILLRKRFIRSIESKQVDEIQSLLLSKRELADQTARQTLAFLKKWRIMTDMYAVLLVLLGSIISVCNGWSMLPESYVIFDFYAAVLIMSGLSRIRFRMPTAFMEDDKSYVEKADYPYIYAMTEQAARESGCTAPVRISFTTDGNIGIADLGSAVSLELGTLLLSVLSEKELSSILNHEFAHVIASKQNREQTYSRWLQFGKPLHFLFWLTENLFGHLDSVYDFHYFLYQYATSVALESAADRAMVRTCDKATAGSALLKTYYCDRYEYESGTYDQPSLFVDETPASDILQQRIADFRRRMSDRCDTWNAMIPHEIMAQSASHPTLKMRLAALGVTEYRTLPDTGSVPYEQERDKAVNYLDQLIYEKRSSDYEELRQSYYIEPLRRINEWTAAGQPLTAEEYRDIVQALQALGRVAEAEKLCDRAIRELPDAASPDAYFTRGRLRLHRYDDRGLDDLYHAMTSNGNYVNDSLEEIGAYCCITGNQKELDRYRGQAAELMQKDKDEYSQVSELKRGDSLSAEHLPDGVLEDILTYIHSIENGEILQIYLVRKTITEEFFTSAFVVKFEDGTDPDTQHIIMHKIFLYLDTVSDWQYSLFDYRSAAKARVETIPGSLVYEKHGDKE